MASVHGGERYDFLSREILRPDAPLNPIRPANPDLSSHALLYSMGLPPNMGGHFFHSPSVRHLRIISRVKEFIEL